MKLTISVGHKSLRNVVFAVLTYMWIQTVLFVATFNLFSLKLRVLAAAGFIAYSVWAAKRLWQADWKHVLPEPLRINWVLWVVSVIVLCSVHIAGPLTFNPNTLTFDWYKYSIILYDIAQHPGAPMIDLVTHRADLAYYYAIFMPAATLGWLFKPFLTDLQLVNWTSFLFDAWLLIGQILAVTLLPFVINTLFGKYKQLSVFGVSFVLLVLFAQMDGWEFLLRSGQLYTSDIEWGPIPAGGMPYFYPLRLQSILSYSHWIPGHLTASLLGLGTLLATYKLVLKSKMSLVLVYLFIVSSSLFALISVQLFTAYLILVTPLDTIKTWLKTQWAELAVTLACVGCVLLLFLQDTLRDLPNLPATITKLGLLLTLLICLGAVKTVRRLALTYWYPLSLLGAALLFIQSFVTHNQIFSWLDAQRYFIFFAKEFGHVVLLAMIAMIALRKWILPKIVVLAFTSIVLLSLRADADFMFSGSIGALFIIIAYLAYLLERLIAEKRWWGVGLFISIYIILALPSYYSMAYEMILGVSRTPQTFEQRITNWRQEWLGLFERYTSDFTNENRL